MHMRARCRRIADEAARRPEFRKWNFIHGPHQPGDALGAEVGRPAAEGPTRRHQVQVLPGREALGDIGQRLTELLKFEVAVLVGVDVAPDLLDGLPGS